MSATNGNQEDPLVKALQRKTNYQADRIDELETTIAELEADLTQIRRQLAEVER